MMGPVLNAKEMTMASIKKRCLESKLAKGYLLVSFFPFKANLGLSLSSFPGKTGFAPE